MGLGGCMGMWWMEMVDCHRAWIVVSIKKTLTRKHNNNVHRLHLSGYLSPPRTQT